jgi:3D-(3,5/4)-trihydroxycyclohexane-1,2-dione acylhydrolase (decyclizing)
VQAEAYDYPEVFFAPYCWRIRRPPPDPAELGEAAAALSQARAPLIIAGGGVHYALACETLVGFAARHGVPVAETQAGKGAPGTIPSIWVRSASPARLRPTSSLRERM